MQSPPTAVEGTENLIDAINMLNGTLASSLECHTTAVNNLRMSVDLLTDEMHSLNLPELHDTLGKAVNEISRIDVGKQRTGIESFTESLQLLSKLNDS